MHIPVVDRWLIDLWKKWVLAGRSLHVPPKEASLIWGLSHNSRYKFSLIGIFALFVAVYYLAFVLDDSLANAPMWKQLLIQCGLLAIVGLSFYSVASAFFDKVELSERGLTIHALFRASITVKWGDIRSLALASSVNRENIVMRTNGGLKRKISLFMNGLGTFRAFLERTVPLEKWEDADAVLPYIGEPN